MNKISNYFYTIKYLKFKQIYFRLFYFTRNKLRKVISFKYHFSKSSTIVKLRFKKSINNYLSYIKEEDKDIFKFLNQEKSFSNEIEWDFEEYGKLWTYNLNYFDYLNQYDINTDDGLRLIYKFIDTIEHNKSAMEPFPISLRGINWIKFLIYNGINENIINDSLYAQYYILMDNLEYHVLGNHLLENGFSLLFGAYYFKDDKLYKKAKKILIDELNEQILNDGAHYELSPMYHQLMLYRVLDVINLVESNKIFNQELLNTLKDYAKKMLNWLQKITFENGNIPLFNDSANKIAPSTKDLLEYSKRLDIKTNVIGTVLSECGYRKYKNKKFELVVDVGNIGPDYILGHAHSDTFNFELYIDNKPFIVDTGTSTYESNNRRFIERSTASHNTVQINNIEQSQIWSSFRVAKRAKVIDIKEKENSVVAIHDGYKDLGILHQREFSLFDNEIKIEDLLLAKSQTKYKGNSFFHFHPDIKNIELCGDTVTTKWAKIVFKNAKKIKIVDCTLAKEFNKMVKSKKIVVSFDKKVTVIIKMIKLGKK